MVLRRIMSKFSSSQVRVMWGIALFLILAAFAAKRSWACTKGAWFRDPSPLTALGR